MASSHPLNIPDFDNLMNPVNIRNPFPLYAWMRESSPVFWSKHMNGWLLTRFADVRSALGDPRRYSSVSGAPVLARADALPAEARADFQVGYRFFYQQIQAFDAPVHTLQRSLITKAFSARVMESMRGRIQNRIDALIDGMEAKQACDFVSDFAYPLPSLVIFDLLGVPEEHYRALRHSADAFARFLPATLTGDVNTLRHIAETLQKTDTLLRGLISERRREPQLDLLSALVSVREDQTQLSDDDIVVLSNFLLFAGHETTANLLAGSILHLLQDRRLWTRLLDSPGLLGNAIEELLRFVSPVLSMGRIATEDFELHGMYIKKGQRVSMMIGAANHDPAQFNDPDSLVLDRARVQSLAFGHGVHYCVGALLARTEAELALRTLLTRLPNLQLLPAEVEYQPIFFLRALKALPVSTS
jgi:cytochrome P450